MPHPSIEGVLAEFEPRPDVFPERAVSSAIMRASPDAANRPKDVQAELLAFAFRPSRTGRSPWDTYYGPEMWHEDDEGNVVNPTPDIAWVDAEMVKHWETRADEATHPVLKMRYADLAWDLGKKIKGATSSPACARIAVQAAIACAALDAEKEVIRVGDKLNRGLSIAISLNDNQLIEASRDALISFAEAIADDKKPGLWGLAFDTLVGNKKARLTNEQEVKLVQDLETRLARLSGQEGHADPWGAESAALRLANHYRRKDQQDDVRRVLLMYLEAYKKLIASGANALVAYSWMHGVYETFIAFNLHKEAEELQPTLVELGQGRIKELKPTTVTIDYPKEHVEGMLQLVVRDTLAVSLSCFAKYGIVDYEGVKKALGDPEYSQILTAALPMELMDSSGRSEAKIGSIRGDLDGRVVEAMRSELEFQRLWIEPALDAIREKFTPTADVLTDYLFESASFLAEERALIHRGLEHYLAGDHMSAAHLLVPRIEGAVRHVVRIQGGPIFTHDPHLGGTPLRTLDKLIRDPMIEHVFDDSGVRYLLVLLTDRRGINARNNICHGLLGSGAFDRVLGDRVFHALILLGQTRTGPKTGESDSGEESKGEESE